MSGRRFDGLKASNYIFREPEGDRDVIAIFAGSKKIAFLEYDSIDRLVDRLHALQHQHASKEGEHEGLPKPPMREEAQE